MHHADARLKFLATIGFILCVSLLPAGSFAALGIAWLAVMSAAVLAHIHPLRVVRGSFIALPFAAAAVPLIFTKSGDPWFDINAGLFTLTVSGEGVRLVATILLKSWVSVQAATLLVFSTTFHDLVHGLERLRLPKLMVAVISLMYRYLAVLTDESSRMLRARASRSAEMPGAPRVSTTWKMRTVGNMVGALFIRAYERSERVYTAMQARGYTGQLLHHDVRGLRQVEWAVLWGLGAAYVVFSLTARQWMPHS